MPADGNHTGCKLHFDLSSPDKCDWQRKAKAPSLTPAMQHTGVNPAVCWYLTAYECAGMEDQTSLRQRHAFVTSWSSFPACTT